MAKKIILAADVRKGDSLKVKYVYCDLITTREGIADHMEGASWQTAMGVNLGTATRNATIQLLSRPEPHKPVIVLPTGQHAVISYRKANGAKWIGVLSGRLWYFVEESTLGVPGAYEFSKRSESLQEFLTINGRTDYTVHFAGVSK